MTELSQAAWGASIPEMADLDAQILRAAERCPGISALVLFGSRAKGTARPDSDLDVAVLPEAGADRRRLQSGLAAALASLSPDGRVDVVLLDEAPVLLRQRVLESGRLLICRDSAAWRDLRVQTMREWGDQEHWREIYIEAQRRRLEEGRPSGRSGRALVSLERVGKLSR